jgi:hypothetical protein
MNKEEIKNLITESNKGLLDEFSKVSIGLRESLTPSHSQLMNEIKNEIVNIKKENERTTKDIMDKLNPVYNAFQKANGFKAGLYLISATIASIAGIVISYREIFKK